MLAGLSGVAPARAQQIRFQNYADAQGLGDLSVMALAQDPSGLILVATENGLYRYDSVGFTPFDPSSGLPSGRRVDDVTVDPAGRTLVALDGDVYTRANGGRFTRIASDRALPVEGRHRMTTVGHDIVVSSGHTVLRATAAAPDGVTALTPLFDPATLAATPALAQASFVAADGHALLIGCGSAICRVDGRRVEVLDQRAGLPPDAWQVAVAGRDGTIWARSLTWLAWRPPGAATFSTVPIPGSHTRYRTHPDTVELVEDRAGRILTQTDDGLLVKTGGEWRLFHPQADGQVEGTIRPMMFDREDLLWLGSRGGGVFRSLGYGSWEHWDTLAGLPSNLVWGMVRVPGHPLWVVTDVGTGPLPGYGGPPGILRGANFTAVASRQGRMWVAPLDAPLTRIDPATGATVQIGQLGYVRTTLIDGDDRLWIGGNDGLYRVDDADAATPPAAHPEKGVPRQGIFRIVSDPSGDVWVLGDAAIFHRHRSGIWERLTCDALPHRPRSMAFRTADEIWVGTSSDGVLRFRLHDGLTSLPAITAPTIASNSTLFTSRDSRGWLWIGTDRGIDMFDGSTWRRFEKNSGPSSNDMDESAVYEDGDGSMWFGSGRGLSHLLDPAHLRPEPALHPVVTRVVLGRHALDVQPSLHVGWSREPLIVDFAALDFGHERTVQFRYRLIGVDADWNTTADHEVRYAGLPAGRLAFQVSAFDPVHGNGSNPTGFVIKIRAPWWQRWWFHAVEGLVALAVIAGAWQLRISLLLRGQRRLEQMVRDRTREIEEARRELLLQAMSDGLTGLANRRAIMAHLEAAMVDARRRGGSLAVLLIDIDHFKAINDTLGHLTGDAVLQQLSRRMRDSLGATEAAGRYGGEEFLLVMPDPVGQAVARVGQLRRQLTGDHFDLGGTPGPVTISGGLAWLKPDDNVLTMLGRADAALYRAKRGGRNRIVASDDDADADGSAATMAAGCRDDADAVPADAD